MKKEERMCKCGESVIKHEVRKTKISQWREKCLVEGSKCKRYVWANRDTPASKVSLEDAIPALTPASV